MAETKMGWEDMRFNLERGCGYCPKGRENSDECCSLNGAWLSQMGLISEWIVPDR